MTRHGYRKIEDLPETIPVFPLTGALLFPRWSLPLNIFEPRYLNMIDDAMSGSRLIGMVQPATKDRRNPQLAGVGCAGRLTSYSETDDGRYLISLTGICRFNVRQELDIQTPYRQVAADWAPFAADLQEPDLSNLPDRDELAKALRKYVATHAMDVDWDAVETAPIETLVHALAAGCPFAAMEKQALLEAETVAARCRALITLLDMDAGGDDSSTLQ
ncbi:MAG: peptidase S16 [Henriciella sp.]|jgi:Lon protease-like protein|uniref:LON peptidase substrate-binding domain-containing protein n=1 Tax=Henriciella sp. TaxID=1968823 RepID=UPI000C0F0E94|nr:LON peptidase substrate-binding domain-containing protein [Henriciella sp.]MAN75060.1 peptidase S16 [Henriciella sp.]MBF33743.1 peptidase S16 [Hyphomonadaceae bacterium]MBK76854.1 peptidase S16 [Henriciella sp.]PHR74778.1 MAG: peptidase S16 [Henriciella sp.]|tara:strand:+ start:1958 stop:2608 length:651 start_codon:yes stop_codon:yes gene_type:complete